MAYSPPKCVESRTIECLLKLLPPAERLSVSLNSGGVPRRGEESGEVAEYLFKTVITGGGNDTK